LPVFTQSLKAPKHPTPQGEIMDERIAFWDGTLLHDSQIKQLITEGQLSPLGDYWIDKSENPMVYYSIYLLDFPYYRIEVSDNAYLKVEQEKAIRSFYEP
jgi:hypothetical protein